MENVEADSTIKVGEYVVVQRQGYTKLHKLKKHGNVVLGSFTLQMDNVIGEKKVEDVNTATLSLNIEKSGVDNRNIPINADSQTLTKEDIDKLKDEKFSSNNIVEQLITNSRRLA
ncbi:hypothetical protein NQ317_016102 [Molorchus minor]|uniref:tRNA (adenine(58)-N(1))-methyltransferase non-catalytic subunit TRM6 n=1 Tax=Molorchus minor TaxID=1323400 RepID=A0ABQ9JI59_9CUCU|nr:hypothetical protein NQ317_016102 [Molorchus minor]